MPFVQMSPAAWKYPFGPARFGTWLQNLAWTRGAFERQHLASTGEHNALEVPRVCRRITWTSGTSTYALADSSTDITAVTRVAAGHIRLTLAASRFTTDMRVQVNVAGSGVESKPWLYRVEVTSATQLEVYLHRLSDALGAGNTWAANDTDFDIAIHSAPLASTQYAVAPVGVGSRFPTAIARRQTLSAPGYGATPQPFNEALFHIANLRKQFLVEHNTDGSHNTRQVARHFCQGRFRTAGTYDIYDELGVNTFTLAEAAAGQVTVTLSAALTTAVGAFVCPDWTRQDSTVGSSGDVTIIHAKTDSTSQLTLWMYRYDRVGDTWSRARADFWLVVHSG